jgi:hypothetical protein
MEDRIIPSGEVKIEVIKASGRKIVDMEGPNTVHLDVKHEMANACVLATAAFGVMESAFDNDTFTTPTSGDSGIIIRDNAGTPVLYEMESTLLDSNAYDFTVKGVARASQSYTIVSAILGHGWSTSSTDFDVRFSDHTFASTIDLVDGDQLNVTWKITIANS